ncbi:uncharacterized protein BXIN_0858 [Babesia sp. Xinjiang]|uniref:uncharacterized protein n=1 Tax=Babesia sp. Xinjiang TaxID=462227 RepID=UPI000A262D25|nr:uncharacterized protein BXIN_0858 [Babesia sp. Xinjiang]ORM41276.1 hypothetical protein BXIN_0858 [Babesia sp. Xinjiang]
MIVKMFVALYVSLWSTLSSWVRSDGRCTGQDVIKLGFKGEPLNETYPTRLGLIRSVIMQWVTLAPGMISCNRRMMLAAKLQKLLRRDGLQITPTCLYCFVEKAQCVQTHCYDSCRSDEYGEGCVSCVDQHCLRGFARCVGTETLSPVDCKDYLMKTV